VKTTSVNDPEDGIVSPLVLSTWHMRLCGASESSDNSIEALAMPTQHSSQRPFVVNEYADKLSASAERLIFAPSTPSAVSDFVTSVLAIDVAGVQTSFKPDISEVDDEKGMVDPTIPRIFSNGAPKDM